MVSKNKNRVCVGASSGGHMTELLGLLETVEIWPVKPTLYVTTRDIWAKKLEALGTTYIVGECDRNKPFRILLTFARSLYFVLKERPGVVITTGSLPIAIVCLTAKLFGSKVVWIDSVAQLEDLSLSGKLMLNRADLLLTQWPEVAARYPGAEYVGELQ
jgi:UDP-N-acetylglucosamine:LPS N-acetylglucosamine transferase